MEQNANKIFDFIKSLFLPRKMAKHMNMSFLLSLVILLAASCLNIVTSNTRAHKDVEKILQFPALYDSVPSDIVLTNENGETLPKISLENDDNHKITLDGQTYDGPSKYLKSDKNGVYHGLHQTENGNIDVTVVIDDNLASGYGNVDKPLYVEFFDIEGYLQQEKKENTDYILYVLTLDNLYYLFNLDQVKDGKSTKAATNSVILETKETGELKYYLPKDESELKLNQYGDFDTTLWSRLASSEDVIDFAATTEAYENSNVKDKLKFEQYSLMINGIKPAYRHLKNLSNALYGGVISYSNLQANEMEIEKINISFSEFQTNLKSAMILFNAGLLKTSSLIVSIVITLLFPFLLAGITWIMSKSFVMNRFRQYYAICALCFGMTTFIALVAGFFVNYTDMAFALLVIASVYYIVATFRINTMDSEKNNDDKDKKEERKEPIKYSKISDDTTFIG